MELGVLATLADIVLPKYNPCFLRGGTDLRSPFQLTSTVKWVLGVSGGDLAVFDSSTWWLGTLRTNYRKRLCHFLTWATRIGPSRNCSLCISPCALCAVDLVYYEFGQSPPPKFGAWDTQCTSFPVGQVIDQAHLDFKGRVVPWLIYNLFKDLV